MYPISCPCLRAILILSSFHRGVCGVGPGLTERVPSLQWCPSVAQDTASLWSTAMGNPPIPLCVQTTCHSTPPCPESLNSVTVTHSH